MGLRNSTPCVKPRGNLRPLHPNSMLPAQEFPSTLIQTPLLPACEDPDTQGGLELRDNSGNVLSARFALAAIKPQAAPRNNKARIVLLLLDGCSAPVEPLRQPAPRLFCLPTLQLAVLQLPLQRVHARIQHTHIIGVRLRQASRGLEQGLVLAMFLR